MMYPIKVFSSNAVAGFNQAMHRPGNVNVIPTNSGVVASIAARLGFNLGKFAGNVVQVGKGAVVLTGAALRQVLATNARIREYFNSKLTKPKNVGGGLVAQNVVAKQSRALKLWEKVRSFGREMANIGRDVRDRFKNTKEAIKSEYQLLNKRSVKRRAKAGVNDPSKLSVGTKVGNAYKAFYRGRVKADRTRMNTNAHSKFVQGVRDFKNEASVIRGSIIKAGIDAALAAGGIAAAIWASGQSKEDEGGNE